MGKKLTHGQFMERLILKNTHYRDGSFTISGIYQGMHDKIEVISKYGTCAIRPHDMLKSNSNVRVDNANNKYTYTVNNFNDVHSNRYTYPIFPYVGRRQKIEIICKKHGVFTQTIGHHLNGSGCKSCNGGVLYTIDEVINKGKVVHNNLYSYPPNQIYEGSGTILNIICWIHGVFMQVSSDHLEGCGCPECGNLSRMGNKGGYSRILLNSDISIYKNTKCLLYFLKLSGNGEDFYKVGITVNKLSKRLSSIRKYNKQVIKEVEMNLYDAYIKEQSIIKKFANFKYVPKIKISGYTECFSINISNINK